MSPETAGDAHLTVTCHSGASAAPEIAMLLDLAQYLSGLGGKGPDVRGVISTDALPGAIARLEEAVRDDAARERAHEHSTQALRDDPSPHRAQARRRAA
ncbi:hypothetical protein CFB41_19925 [Burkholderia sp. AU33803]|nr:hypothetical protein CFB41_19925 [Burkholderia sp. AU33803]PRD84502.1 DUF1840 domain-containing protein [Burkholderia contaminans]